MTKKTVATRYITGWWKNSYTYMLYITGTRKKLEQCNKCRKLKSQPSKKKSSVAGSWSHSPENKKSSRHWCAPPSHLGWGRRAGGAPHTVAGRRRNRPAPDDPWSRGPLLRCGLTRQPGHAVHRHHVLHQLVSECKHRRRAAPDNIKALVIKTVTNASTRNWLQYRQQLIATVQKPGFQKSNF